MNYFTSIEQLNEISQRNKMILEELNRTAFIQLRNSAIIEYAIYRNPIVKRRAKSIRGPQVSFIGRHIQ